MITRPNATNYMFLLILIKSSVLHTLLQNVKLCEDL